jgi:hypothetical protein
MGMTLKKNNIELDRTLGNVAVNRTSAPLPVVSHMSDH